MPQTPQILGQGIPTAGVDTLIASVPGAATAQMSIFICNQSSVLEQVSIALVPGTQTTPPSDQLYNYIAYNTPIIGNGIFSFSGIFLNTGDTIRMKTINGTASVTVTGVVNT